jgi:uncharacterized membrane protein YjgN (DUF898 family)
MNNPSQTPQLSFHGDGKTLFKIWITNLLLTICTLGVYYPWARANMKKYLYSSTYFGDQSFEFCGTGKQMFIGLVKFLAIAFVLIFILTRIPMVIPVPYIYMEEIGTVISDTFFNLYSVIVYAPILALFIHGACRYRMSKTSYRGIRFGYRGDKKDFVLSVLKYAVFSVLTLGIYYSWLVNNVRKYIYGNTRFGNIKLEFSGKGSDYFGKLVGGYFLCIITLGIYYVWFKKELFKFFYENMSFSANEQSLKVKTDVTAGKYLSFVLGNLFILLFTLGLGYPFIKVRSMRFLCDNLEFYGDLDLDKVTQTEENYADATGDAETNIDDSGDFFDLDVF